MIQWSESEYTDNTDVDAAPRAANPIACHTAPRSLRARVISSICIVVLCPLLARCYRRPSTSANHNLSEMHRHLKPMWRKTLRCDANCPNGGEISIPLAPLRSRRGEEVYAPFACVRGRERAERCERGMDGEVWGMLPRRYRHSRADENPEGTGSVVQHHTNYGSNSRACTIRTLHAFMRSRVLALAIARNTCVVFRCICF